MPTPGSAITPTNMSRRSCGAPSCRASIRTKVLDSLTIFSGAARIEGVHPLQFGFFRRKLRTQRRSGMPVLNPLVFYPWRLFDFLKVTSQWWPADLALSPHHGAGSAKDPAARTHFDEALRPHTGTGDTDHFVEVFADKIPHTHGAPVAPVRVPVRSGGIVYSRPRRFAADLAFRAVDEPRDIGAVHDPEQDRERQEQRRQMRLAAATTTWPASRRWRAAPRATNSASKAADHEPDDAERHERDPDAEAEQEPDEGRDAFAALESRARPETDGRETRRARRRSRHRGRAPNW